MKSFVILTAVVALITFASSKPQNGGDGKPAELAENLEFSLDFLRFQDKDEIRESRDLTNDIVSQVETVAENVTPTLGAFENQNNSNLI